MMRMIDVPTDAVSDGATNEQLFRWQITLYVLARPGLTALR